MEFILLSPFKMSKHLRNILYQKIFYHVDIAVRRWIFISQGKACLYDILTVFALGIATVRIVLT